MTNGGRVWSKIEISVYLRKVVIAQFIVHSSHTFYLFKYHLIFIYENGKHCFKVHNTQIIVHSSYFTVHSPVS